MTNRFFIYISLLKTKKLLFFLNAFYNLNLDIHLNDFTSSSFADHKLILNEMLKAIIYKYLLFKLTKYSALNKQYINFYYFILKISHLALSVL